MRNKENGEAEAVEIKYCRNKKCHKPLPAGYKHNYCEACRNQQAQKAKDAGKGILAGVGAIASVAVVIITGGKSIQKSKEQPTYRNR